MQRWGCMVTLGLNLGQFQIHTWHRCWCQCDAVYTPAPLLPCSLPALPFLWLLNDGKKCMTEIEMEDLYVTRQWGVFGFYVQRVISEWENGWKETCKYKILLRCLLLVSDLSQPLLRLEHLDTCSSLFLESDAPWWCSSSIRTTNVIPSPVGSDCRESTQQWRLWCHNLFWDCTPYRKLVRFHIEF